MLTRRNIFAAAAAAAGAAMTGTLTNNAQASRELKPGEWSIEPGEGKGSSHHSIQMKFNLAPILAMRLNEFGIKIIPEPIAFYEGAKIAALSPYGTPWNQLHIDANHDHYLSPRHASGLAHGIANRSKIIRFGQLWLPRPGPEIAIRDSGWLAGAPYLERPGFGVVGAGRMETNDVTLRLLTFLDPFAFEETTRLDALFCEVR